MVDDVKYASPLCCPLSATPENDAGNGTQWAGCAYKLASGGDSQRGNLVEVWDSNPLS